MFTPDQPIDTCEQDLLGRKSFAKSLGDAICSYNEQDSIVVGLYGEWGSGKTSIINMAIEHIEFQRNDKNKPIIIKFNPWNYSDQNQLITQFFRQLSLTLERPDNAKTALEIGKQLETYAKFFEPLSFIPAIGPYAKILGSVFKHLGGASKHFGQLKNKNLEIIRKELDDLLSQLPYKIIIVIDDIDRLTNIEIRQIFQLIKAIGDFPNTVYFLSFDKKIVNNALQKVQEGSGEEYLEKMIQIPFEVPQISTTAVEKILFEKLDYFIKDVSVDCWNQIRWGNIFYGGLKYFFKNIRNVTRYINTVSFNSNILKHYVNYVDLFALIGLQVFMPTVYHSIRANKDSFTGIYSSHTYSAQDKEIEEHRKLFDRIIESQSIIPNKAFQDFLKELFPKVNSVYSNTLYGDDWLNEWKRERRICSPDCFDCYFMLSISDDDISEAEMKDILSLADNIDLFSERIRVLIKKSKIIRFLDIIEGYTQREIPLDNIEVIITALINLGDLFPDSETGMFGLMDTPLRISRIIHQLLKRFDNRESRFTIMKSSIQNAKDSLYTFVHEISLQDQEHGKYGLKDNPKPEEERLLNSQQLEILEEIVCDKIDEWVQDGRLDKHKRLPKILFRWLRWGGNLNYIQQYVRRLISNEGLLEFLSGFLIRAFSQGATDKVGQFQWHMDIENVKKFADINDIEQRLRKIVKTEEVSKYSPNHILTINTFLDTIDGKIETI